MKNRYWLGILIITVLIFTVSFFEKNQVTENMIPETDTLIIANKIWPAENIQDLIPFVKEPPAREIEEISEAVVEVFTEEPEVQIASLDRKPKTDLEVLAYWAKWWQEPEPNNSYQASQGVLDYFSPYWFTLNSSGELVSRETGHKELLNEVHARGEESLVLINNGPGITSLLANKELRAKSIKNIEKLLSDYGFTGVHIDFEMIPPESKDNLSVFMEELQSAIGSKYLVTIAVGPKWSDFGENYWAEVYDYERLAKSVDFMVLMTYDQHNRSTGPGPVASLPWVESVLQYTLTKVPKEKIFLGIAGYGYSWSSSGETSSVRYSEVEQAIKKGATVQWDDYSQTPYTVYWENGVRKEVWFENIYSLRQKISLAERYQIGGLALWSLGQEDLRLWSELAE